MTLQRPVVPPLTTTLSTEGLVERQARLLVARMDNTAASGFAKGSLDRAHGTTLPVCMDYDMNQVVGEADMAVEDGCLYATVKVRTKGERTVELFPGLAIRVLQTYRTTKGAVVSQCHVVFVGISRDNRDKAIPPIPADW